ncbi:MAG: acetate kinase [Fusobacteria bacterium]|nr:acetate kinase [Fusobacteriota bacterium]
MEKKILVLNAGSSSLKYRVFNLASEEVIAIGLVERIGIEKSIINHNVVGKDKLSLEFDLITNHFDAIQKVLDLLMHSEVKIIDHVDEISAVGHRVVHGGEDCTKSTKITAPVKAIIEKCCKLAPLHNPANLLGIEAVSKVFGAHMFQVAAFDTAFHQSMTMDTFIYPLPIKVYKKYKVRKYGFHGISHKYVSERLLEIMGKTVADDVKIITCHLGNGASATAINHGLVLNTSMGFTPLDGISMGTRTGELDPEILLYMIRRFEYGLGQIEEIINKKSGMLGISGISSDLRDIQVAYDEGDERAKVAIDRYVEKLVAIIGGYTAELSGVNAIVFTAGVGENSIIIRELVCNKLGFLGVELDKEKNNCRGKEVKISTNNSKVAVYVIPTDEEYMIMRDTKEILCASEIRGGNDTNS